MAKAGEILLGGAGLSLAALVLYNMHNAHNAQIMGELKIKIQDVHLTDSDLVLDVEILNPTSSNMAVKSFVGSMFVNTTKVADINMFGDYTARANLNVTIPLIVKPYNAKLFAETRKLFLKGGTRITYEGTVNVNDHAIPLKFSYNR